MEFGGVGALHAAFLTESRTRGHVRCSVQEFRVAYRIQPMYAEVANMGHPSRGEGLRGKLRIRCTMARGNSTKQVFNVRKSPTLSREVMEVMREARAHLQSRQVAGPWSRLKSTYQKERSIPVEDR